MNDFEKGIRFALLNSETYEKKTGHKDTQFGIYQMTMVKKDMTEKSKQHYEDIIRAYLHLAK